MIHYLYIKWFSLRLSQKDKTVVEIIKFSFLHFFATHIEMGGRKNGQKRHMFGVLVYFISDFLISRLDRNYFFDIFLYILLMI